jgi:endonuclease YncB( thermonuclease family)
VIQKTLIYLFVLPIFSAGSIVAQDTANAKPSTATRSAVKGARVSKLTGKVSVIEDGDHLKFAAEDGIVYTVTLLGVDTPDEKQNYYKKAKRRLAELVEGQPVSAILRRTETGELLGTIYVAGQDIGLRLIQDGLAWHYPAHSREQTANERDKYSRAEAAAKTSRIGLWEDKEPVSPWAFRKEIIPPETAPVPTPAVNTESSTTTSTPPGVDPAPQRTYILGPRGGCYYLNDKGYKVYVKDKGLCVKP